MPFIAFLGCDGSGKSAVIDAVARRVEEEGVDLERGHWRPSAIGSSNPDAKAATPHDQAPRGRIGSIFKLLWLWCNWWLGITFRFRKANTKGIILFDRYHADLLVDPKRYRYGGSMRLARLASSLMPQPDLVFLLDAPAGILLERKQEIPIESLKTLRNKYLELQSQHNRMVIVDASQGLEHVVKTVFEQIIPLLPERKR